MPLFFLAQRCSDAVINLEIFSAFIHLQFTNWGDKSRTHLYAKEAMAMHKSFCHLLHKGNSEARFLLLVVT